MYNMVIHVEFLVCLDYDLLMHMHVHYFCNSKVILQLYIYILP